jgi:DNA-binding NarL/FixJ family response regulator
MQSVRPQGVAVYLVEDSSAIRARMAEMVERCDARVVGEAETADDAIAGIRIAHPDLVLLDLHLRSGSGLDVLRALGHDEARPVFIVVTNDPNDGYRKACLAAGAREFLDKSHEFLRIQQIIANAAVHHVPQQRA